MDGVTKKAVIIADDKTVKVPLESMVVSLNQNGMVDISIKQENFAKRVDSVLDRYATCVVHCSMEGAECYLNIGDFFNIDIVSQLVEKGIIRENQLSARQIAAIRELRAK